ncbi:LysR family transcriptional regulator [Shewanella fodinae]|jgi:DNA-binding transcriptional LysR family regulator|uniref:LysR family transcriptional regulator n=1 Tax=Shewanella fodinae TaxID=552357 RepID=UPI0016720214|nr:LysR family transcriptional regulator [Shewanella fodinae]MCL2906443.1 LysR family transcriptional regulator [Shewanella fodinae]GGY93216.1 transcriptional regulator [Shewanella fodinae]
MVNIKTLDLNLLRTLDVLLAEHNVTRTAQRLHLSQPTISVQLSKLREIFHDPLLLPDARGMRPTALADQLRQPLRQALAELEQALVAVQPFMPQEANIIWRIAAFDYGETTILRPALAQLRQLAPHAKIAVSQVMPAGLQARMERGEIDLAFHVRNTAPPTLRSRLLFSEHYRLAARKGHPALQQPLTLERFCALEHVIVSPSGGGFAGATDAALTAIGQQRNVVLSVPHFLFMVEVLKSSDLVAMLPSRLIDPQQMDSAEAPVAVAPFEMMMLWHERSHRDPSHQWLRELFASSATGAKA